MGEKMFERVGSPMSAFLSNKYVSVPIWPCMTRAHSWPPYQPTLQTHWALSCCGCLYPGRSGVVKDSFWASDFSSGLSLTPSWISNAVKGQTSALTSSADWHVICFISSVPRYPKWCHFFISLWAFSFLPLIPVQGLQLQCGVYGTCTLRCRSLDRWCPQLFLTLPLGRQC